jgi:hypothetical protein
MDPHSAIGTENVFFNVFRNGEDVLGSRAYCPMSEYLILIENPSGDERSP